MARVHVPVDETSDEAISAKAAKLIGEERPAAKKPRATRRLPKNILVKATAVAIATVFVVAMIVLIRDRNSLQKQVDELATQPDSQQAQANELVNLQIELSKFMELPTNETPTLATVNDVEKVKDQTFFKNAQNGDKVLLYSQAGKAILYRPSTSKVIEVAQINPSTPGNTAPQP